MKFVRLYVGRVVSEFGRGLKDAGNIFNLKVIDGVSTAQTVQKIGFLVPSIGVNTFISPNARVVGDPEIGKSSYVGYGAVIRGDVNQVKVGDFVYLGDRITIHAQREGLHDSGSRTLIGNNAVVGASSIINGATLEDNCFVDVSCTICDGAVVGQHCIIAAGSVLLGDARMKPGTYWSGNPAEYVRDLTKEEIEATTARAALLQEESVSLATTHAKATQLKQSLLLQTTALTDETSPSSETNSNSTPKSSSNFARNASEERS